uniref:Uncharacterized protein n=2 Tax=Schistocephalus solidus TaxID=70667 RepID=A0A0X3NNK5_SCHSO
MCQLPLRALNLPASTATFDILSTANRDGAVMARTWIGLNLSRCLLPESEVPNFVKICLRSSTLEGAAQTNPLLSRALPYGRPDPTSFTSLSSPPLSPMMATSANTLGDVEVVVQNATNTTTGCSRILSLVVSLVMGVNVGETRDIFVKDRFYAGCRILQPLSNWCGLSVDVTNFLASALVASLLGLLMRYLITPKRFTHRLRASLEIAFGLLLVYFCFGHQIRVLILQSLVTYLLLRFCRLDQIRTPALVTAWTMFYLMLVHLCRLYYDYEGYTLDISGPLMLQTQRLSSLAFNLYDGARIKKYNAKVSAAMSADDTECESTSPQDVIIDVASAGDGYVLTKASDSEPEGVRTKEVASQSDFPKIMPSSRAYAVEDVPGPLEYAAYSFYFHGVCIGPLVFYRDYRNYLGGYDTGELPPISCRRVLILLLRAMIYGGAFAALSKRFPLGYIATDNFRVSFIAASYCFSIQWSGVFFLGDTFNDRLLISRTHLITQISFIPQTSLLCA